MCCHRLHGDDHALHRQVDRLAIAPMIRMFAWCGIKPVHGRLLQAVVRQCFIDRAAELVTATLNTSLPAILMPISTLLVAGSMLKPFDTTAVDVQQILVRAVGVQVRAHDTGLGRRLEHHGAGAVAEQHRGIAIAPVRNARQRLRTDHKRALRLARLDELVRDRQRVDEAAAGRFDENAGQPRAPSRACSSVPQFGIPDPASWCRRR